MSEKLDAILESGCLEKLLDSDKEISTKDEALAYLSENGFSDVSDEDLQIIVEEVKALEAAGGGGSNNNIFSGNSAKQKCVVNLV